ncbi:MAG: hypothetical protein DRP02_06125, partial [Candidatus Gerdarchaeota archaeon]
FTTRDEFLQSTISKRKYREQLQREIAEEARIAPEAVFIDIPTLPSVPYSHSVDLPTYQIPMFVREGPKQKKRPIDLQKVSKIFEALMGMMYIFRVYTFTKEREKVKRAAEKVFSEKTLATKLSF